jgi:hypothetical protein
MADNNDQIIETITQLVPLYTEKSVIMDLVNQRLEFGRKKYGHGVRINAKNLNDYNNNWTETIKDMDWPFMMLEEAIDGIVYCVAEIIKQGEYHPKREELKLALGHMVKATISILNYKDSVPSS